MMGDDHSGCTPGCSGEHLSPHADRMNDDMTPPVLGRCEICGAHVALFRGVVWTPGYPPEPHDDHKRNQRARA